MRRFALVLDGYGKVRSAGGLALCAKLSRALDRDYDDTDNNARENSRSHRSESSETLV